jgi:predicted site-specific integrase-resolvase
MKEVRPIDITANEAAKRLGITRQATTVWAQEGRFPGARKDEYSGLWRIPEEVVNAMAAERERRNEIRHADAGSQPAA